eukprot:NODE_594_length_5604_cov_0.154950.p3 type:complete len:397 gc:universal NODE_594_length_5604_cov_0.154950:5298-4108(-)
MFFHFLVLGQKSNSDFVALSNCETNPIIVNSELITKFSQSSISYFFEDKKHNPNYIADGEYDLYLDVTSDSSIDVLQFQLCGADCSDFDPLPTIEDLKSGIRVNLTELTFSAYYLNVHFNSSNSTYTPNLKVSRLEICQPGKTDLDSCQGFRVCDSTYFDEFDYSNVECREKQTEIEIDYTSKFTANLTQDGSPLTGNPQNTRVFLTVEDGQFTAEEYEVYDTSFWGVDVTDDKGGLYIVTLNQLKNGVRLEYENATYINYRFAQYSELKNITVTGVYVCHGLECHGWSSEHCHQTTTAKKWGFQSSTSKYSSVTVLSQSQSVSTTWHSHSYSKTISKMTSKTWSTSEHHGNNPGSPNEQQTDGPSDGSPESAASLPPAGTLVSKSSSYLPTSMVI